MFTKKELNLLAFVCCNQSQKDIGLASKAVRKSYRKHYLDRANAIQKLYEKIEKLS